MTLGVVTLGGGGGGGAGGATRVTPQYCPEKLPSLKKPSCVSEYVSEVLPPEKDLRSISASADLTSPLLLMPPSYPAIVSANTILCAFAKGVEMFVGVHDAY